MGTHEILLFHGQSHKNRKETSRYDSTRKGENQSARNEYADEAREGDAG